MFPIKSKVKLPKSNEPGSFGFVRKHDIHTGVDLYCPHFTAVYAIEDGEIIRVGQFTGGQESPWWNDTDFILIKGKSGCILYGEIEVAAWFLRVTDGETVKKGDCLGYVIPVLKKDKGLPMTMLHIELYNPKYEGNGEIWKLNQPQPELLWDITPLLKRELNSEKPFLRRIFGYFGINI
jgi:murein DD-endopeptidase MepM/ murein hydrolase activator NlpD